MEEVGERRGSGGAGSPRPASRAGSLTPVVSGPRPGQRPESQPGSDCSDGSEEASPEAAPEAAAAGSAAGAQEETRGCPEAVHGGRPPLAPAAAPAQPEAEEAQAARKGARVTFNASHTDYDVVLAAAEARGWRVVKNEDKAGQCHVHWIDDGQPPTIGDWLKRIEPWMRVNHFPGMNNALARKTRLARNMSRMQRIFPKEYNFLPPTWVLPDDLGELERRIGEDSKVIYIVKPDHLCQGRGIFLTTDLDRIRQCTKEMREKDQAAVVQRYLMRPMLIDGLKFDLRLYFLVCGKPSQGGLDLRCFLFKDGLVRLCTTPYQPPTEETMKQKCMHLTNYAINKKSKNFQQNDGEDGGSTGNKRSLSWFLNYVEEEHGPKERRKLWIKMMGLCSKLLLTVQPTLEAEYSGVFPRDLSGGDMGCRCFEVLGIDVMLDSKMKPYLIEVNHLPSFTCDSPLDEDIKRRLIDQTMDLTCGSVTNSAKKASENCSLGKACKVGCSFAGIRPLQLFHQVFSLGFGPWDHHRSIWFGQFRGKIGSTSPPRRTCPLHI
ncbi:unnamed protein product [Prorocentrum cordatum]|uniref:Tubulin--tyrosine ligase-like protein 9 n=1 Tax=Prorocentrum cordatum TaxID=2364126 RepID=A0ABN9UYH0_9DINO|nr:unnamed protein product [Polarella glacialis]